MAHPETRLLATTALAALALAGSGVQAAGLHGEQYALVAPSVFQRSTSIERYLAPKVRHDTKKKYTRAGKKKILAGMQNFRSSARRALDRARPARHADESMRATAPMGSAEKSQSRWYAELRAVAKESIAAPAMPGAPSEKQPPFVGASVGFPGFVPADDTNYEVSLNLPLGRYENVLLQANVRRNVYDDQGGRDSMLRADWSVRF
jgi:hypothetical protein